MIMENLKAGIADEEEMKEAALLLRELYRQHAINPKILFRDKLYQLLLSGEATSNVNQEKVHYWITRLQEGRLSIDEHTNKQHLHSPANEKQIGGQHYKKGIQHWDYVTSNYHSYLAGQVSKYLSRWKDKNGKEDLEKAAHFLEKMIEIHNKRPQPIQAGEFCDSQELELNERAIITLVHQYESQECPSQDLLLLARTFMAELLKHK